MKIGASTFNWSRTFELAQIDLLGKIRAHGLQGFEVPIFQPAGMPTASIRKALERNDLECTVCAILPDGINPIGSKQSARKKAQLHLAACIETAAELGAKLMGGPLYAPIGYLPGRRRNADEWQWAVECFQALSALLDSTNMTLALEPVNRSETFFLTTVAEAAELCATIGNEKIGVLLDTFHANIEEKNIAGAIASLGPRLKHVHLSENDRGIPGSGHLDFAGIVRTLRDTHYDGYLMIEGLGYLPPEENTPVFMWRRPDETPDAIVFEGAAYIQDLLSHS